MSRVSKILLFMFVIVFALACNFVTQPLNEAQEAVETARSLATAMPIETLQSFATAMPVETLEAIPSEMPDFENLADPQGEPLEEWNGIPIMPAATAGAESSGIYSFKADASVEEVVEYYQVLLPELGWTKLFSVPDTGSGAFLTYEKGENVITITVASDGEGTLVWLTSQ